MMLFALTFDALAATFLTCVLLRQAFIVVLPNQIAGPGGSFIDTNR